MIGVRTAVVVGLCAGLAWVAGQPQFARDVLSQDSSWKSRLQILVGRPSAPAAAPGEENPSLSSQAAPIAGPRGSERTLPPVASSPASFAMPPAADADTFVPSPPRQRPERAEGIEVEEPAVDRFLGEFVTTERVNLRAGPGQQHARIDVISAGRSLSVTGRTRDRAWYQVRYRDRTLYVAADMVRADSISTESGSLSLGELAEDLDAIAINLKRARFREVLTETSRLRPEVEGAARWIPLDKQLVALEVMAATSELALSRMTDASRSLERALAIDAELSLDPAQSPPKLLRLLAQVRRSR